MGIFSKINFLNRKFKKQASEWLKCRYWNLSDLAKFLEEKGIKTPVTVYSYNSLGQMRLKADNGRWYTLRFATSPDGYGEIYLTKGHNTYKYGMGYAPYTCKSGIILELPENQYIEVWYGESSVYEFYCDEKKVLHLRLQNPSKATQKAEEVILWLETTFDPFKSYSADKILEDILDYAEIDEDQELEIEYNPIKAPEGKIFTKLCKIEGEVTEYEAIEGEKWYSYQKGVGYKYTDPKAAWEFDLKKKIYRKEAEVENIMEYIKEMFPDFPI